ncbi:MAG: formylmethanofuran dehydrogenase subunit B [Planctomycetaceae bacterium]|nr:formylmethanofuran dehydrogenase subunit B [Planctomycetaceae bacterium]
MFDRPSATLQTVSDVACTVCGCVCDDLEVTVSNGRLSEVSRACSLAKPWFDALARFERHSIGEASIHGQAASRSAAVAEAARILLESRAPLIWGLSQSSTPGQREAVHLAELLGATIDTTASVCHGPSIMAIQSAGESTCSLGEVRNRADLVVFWGTDPCLSHPRHMERYSAEIAGEFVPRGRQDRFLVVIDVERTATAEMADLFIPVTPGRDFEVVWTLRHLLRGGSPPPDCDLGADLDQLQTLTNHLRNCRYGVVFFGLGLAQRGQGHLNVDALLRLVADLNRHTRFCARRMRIPGDVSGADSVLCWQTGFPFAVNLQRGYPRYNPGEFTANELLEREEVDACLLVGSEAVSELSPKAIDTLAHIPVISLDSPHLPPAIAADVQFRTAIYGVHAPGTVYRMDEIPIPARRFLTTDLPTDDEVLSAIRRSIAGD